MMKIFKERYTHQVTPDVALATFFYFKQTLQMPVDMSLKALVINGLHGDVVDKSRNAVLHSMLLGNLSPEIRREGGGGISKNPQTPEKILKVALLEEKTNRSINSFYNLQG